MIGQVKKILTDNPTATIISVSQNDNGAYCQTPEELAIIKEEGTPGGALFRAINVIAAAIKDEFPAVAIDTLAYQWSRPAPSHTVPLPNVIIRLCCTLRALCTASPRDQYSHGDIRTCAQQLSATLEHLYRTRQTPRFRQTLSIGEKSHNGCTSGITVRHNVFCCSAPYENRALTNTYPVPFQSQISGSTWRRFQIGGCSGPMSSFTSSTVFAVSFRKERTLALVATLTSSRTLSLPG